MVRSILLSLAVLVTTQVAPALAQTNINVTGKLTGGNFVLATASVSNTGQVSGTGVLYGMNPTTGSTYKYPFTINKVATTAGKVVLSGTLVGAGYPVTLAATVPNGPLTFSYIVNGKVVSMSGTGTVTVK